MSQDDDQDWLDALAGRGTAASPTRREAEVLRAALGDARYTTSEVATDEVGAARREAALLDRAVKEGLIEHAPRRFARWQLSLAASVLLVLAAGIVFQLQPRVPTSDALRGDRSGDERGIVRLTATDPARLERDLLAQLRAAGVEATGYEALDVRGIDADLALPLSPQVQRVLDAHGIPAPADGVLRIEIRRSE